MGRAAKRKSAPKRVLRLLDLEHSKHTLLSTLGSPNSKKAYEFAIDHFVTWYCSEPRLAFSKTVVMRYRLELEARRLAPATINLRLAAVRRLAFEAADTGLLSPELAAGIARVKGAKRIGVRLGNWLTADQGRNLVASPDVQTLKGRRDRAILALMLGCGLRRGEVAGLKVDHLQQREEHWVIADLIGKAAHIRTVPVPDWVKAAVDVWLNSAGITQGRMFRCVSRKGSVWGERITEKVIWYVVKENAGRAGIAKLSPHDCRRTCARLCHAAGGELEQIKFLLGACFGGNDRAIPGVQATPSGRRQRPHRPGALRVLTQNPTFRPRFLVLRLSRCSSVPHVVCSSLPPRSRASLRCPSHLYYPERMPSC